MWQASAETTTTAEPDSIWALWENAERWSAWNEQIAEARLMGPLAVGATAMVRFKGSPLRLSFRITKLEPGRLLVDEAQLPGVRMGHEHLVEREAGKTTIRHRLFIAGALERLYGLLLGRRMRRAVKVFGEREAELAEATPVRLR